VGVGVLVRPPVRPVSLIAIRACAERTAALRGHSQLTRARCSGRTFRIRPSAHPRSIDRSVAPARCIIGGGGGGCKDAFPWMPLPVFAYESAGNGRESNEVLELCACGDVVGLGLLTYPDREGGINYQTRDYPPS